MSTSLQVASSAAFVFRSPSKSNLRASELRAACIAARAAIQEFDDGAKRGESFVRLHELSELERSAVAAACATQASTPADIAEKALLLERIIDAGNHCDATLKTVALSLASDAVMLAKTIGVEP
jgi:hypothetical protein